MDEVPRAFAISDIQSSPTGVLVDVGLKFERAEIQMIKWKTEGQVNN